MAKKGLEYIVEYKGLSSGTYEIDYHIDSEFFEMFPDSEFKDADVDVHITMDVSLAGLVIDFDIDGTVKAECDRCMELFDLPIEAQYNMVVKFGDKSSSPYEADETITLSIDETSIDLSQHIYEFVVLSVPARRVHPDDEDGVPMCNPDMARVFEEMEIDEDELPVDYDDGDEDDFDDEGEPDGPGPDGIDPRWDKLRNLL